MDLYLVRHGETESNIERRYQGWTESPLSQAGIRQAEKAAHFLGRQNLSGLYCSDLSRAFHTARVIGSSSGLKPEATPLLREINFGSWEGMTFDEIEQQYGTDIRNWLDDPFKRSAPGGETLDQVCARMKSFLEHLEQQASDGQSVAAVSHGGSIRALLFDVIGMSTASFWDLKVENASISLVRKENGRYKVAYYNRTDHLT